MEGIQLQRLFTTGRSASVLLATLALASLFLRSNGNTPSPVATYRAFPCIKPMTNCDPHQMPRYFDEDKIIGGEVAEQGTTPWLVSLKDTNYNDPVHFCGGAIISHYWVITSGSCVSGYSEPIYQPHIGTTIYREIQVVVGEYDLDVQDGWEHSKYVTEIHLHPEYDFYTNDHDVALLHVWPKIYYNRMVAALPLMPHFGFRKLPPQDLSPQEDLQEQQKGKNGMCRIAGWGRTSEISTISHLVLEAYIPLLPRDECEKSYDDAFTDSMICAGNFTYGGLDPCQGDWGGPLVTEEGKLRGVASWSIGCGRPGFPGVYTDITKVMDWICDYIHCD